MKKRSFVTILLALIMACTSVRMFPVYAETEASGEETEFTPITEGFEDWPCTEDGTLTAKDDSWYAILSRDGGNKSSLVTEANGNQYVQFEYTTADNKDYVLRKDGLNVTQTVVIEESFKTTNNGNTRNFIMPLYDGNNVRVLTLMFRNKEISALNGSQFMTIGNFAPNTWYDIRMVVHVDETTQKATTYDVYINNALKAENFALESSIAINKVGLLLSTAYTTGNIMLDDFAVKAYNSEFVPFKFYEDFEKSSAGALSESTLSLPGYYTVGTAGVNDAAVIEEASGNKVFKLMDKSGSKTAEFNVGTNDYPLNVTGPFVMEARIKVDSTSLLFRPFNATNSAGTTATVPIQLDNGNVKVNGTSVSKYSGNTWFNIKLKVNSDGDTSTNDTFDLYINDKYISTDTLSCDMTTLKRFSIQIGYANGASLYVDDIMIYPVEEDTTDIFSEDFTYYGLNNFMELGYNSEFWKVGGIKDTVNNSIAVALDEGTENRVLKLKTLQGTETAGLEVNGAGLDLKGKIVLEQDVKFSRNDTRAIMFRLYDASNAAVNTVWLNNSTRTLIAFDGSTEMTLAHVNADKWINIKIVVNVDGNASTTDKYDVYINNELKAENLTLGTLSSAVKRVQFMEYMCWGVESIACIDNMRIYSIPDTSLRGKISFTDSYGLNVDALYGGESITITANVSNNTSEAQNPILLVAMYDASVNRLKSVQSVAFETPLVASSSDELELTLMLPENVENINLKAFLWNGLDKLIPVAVDSLSGAAN